MTANSIQNLFSKDSLINTALTTGASALASRFIPVSLKECALLGAATSTFSSIGNAVIGKDASDFKKMIVSVAALAAMYFGAVSFAPMLNARFAFTLTNEAISKVLAFNALGQVVSFALSKTLLATPWDYSDRQIRNLHATPEKFAELSSTEQQLVYHRFKLLGLNIAKFTPAHPSEDDLAALSDTQVRALHANHVYLNDSPKWNALLLRFFNLGLEFRPYYYHSIKDVGLPMLEKPEEVHQLSPNQLMWFKELFKDSSTRRNYPCEIQRAFYQHNCTDSFRFNLEMIENGSPGVIHNIMIFADAKWMIGMAKDELAALLKRCDELGIDHFGIQPHPQTAKEVRALSEDMIRLYHTKIDESNHSEEALAEFNLRFYELKLPLPNKNTIDKIIEEKKSHPIIKIDLPKSVKDVQDLDDNQLPWVYSALKKDGWRDFSYEVQEALNVRFDKNLSWRNWFTFSKLTPDNVANSSKEAIKILESQLKKKDLEWIALPQAVQQALNARFEKPHTLEEIDIEKLSDVKAYHAAFTQHTHSWDALSKAKQQAFNAAFTKVEGLSALSVKKFWQ